MKIHYDSSADALYIRIIDGDIQCRSLRLSDEVCLNIGEHEQLVGIEILDAKETVGKGKVPEVVLENVQSVLSN